MQVLNYSGIYSLNIIEIIGKLGRYAFATFDVR